MPDFQFHSCPNCGTPIRLDATTTHHVEQRGALSTPKECPVCHYRLPAWGMHKAGSRQSFERQIHSILEQACTTEQDLATLMRVLKDELAFLAEFQHPGHRFYVDIMDLGSYSDSAEPEQPHQALRERWVGQQADDDA